MILPFDPVVAPHLLQFIKALCLHLDGKVDYITMGGFGYKTESYMPLPTDINYPASATDFIALWVASANVQIDTHAQSLRQTPFILAAGTPFNDPGAVAALSSVINHGLIYNLFGLQQWGLNANTNGNTEKSFYINKFIFDTASTHLGNGFQMTGSETNPHVGGNLNGTLEECLAAAKANNAHYVEIYGVDGENLLLAPMLRTYNDELK